MDPIEAAEQAPAEQPESPLQAAIRLAGGQAALAKLITRYAPRPCSQQAVSWWLRNDKPVPADFCPAVEIGLQGRVRAHDLNKQIFPATFVAEQQAA